MPKTFTDDQKRREYDDADWLRDTAWRWVLRSPPHENWDHDHCFFCDTHICDVPECDRGLRECWRHDYPDDPGNYESVCNDCFHQIRTVLGWRVLSEQSTTNIS